MKCCYCRSELHNYWDCPIHLLEEEAGRRNEEFSHRQKVERELEKIRGLLEKNE